MSKRRAKIIFRDNYIKQYNKFPPESGCSYINRLIYHDPYPYRYDFEPRNNCIFDSSTFFRKNPAIKQVLKEGTIYTSIKPRRSWEQDASKPRSSRAKLFNDNNSYHEIESPKNIPLNDNEEDLVNSKQIRLLLLHQFKTIHANSKYSISNDIPIIITTSYEKNI